MERVLALFLSTLLMSDLDYAYSGLAVGRPRLMAPIRAGRHGEFVSSPAGGREFSIA
jgi:hypothetical protein